MATCCALDEVRNTALTCARSVFSMELMLPTKYRHAMEDDDLDVFQAWAAAAFGKLARLVQRGRRELPPEVLDSLVLAMPGRGPVTIGKRAFSTWHEAILAHTERMLAIPVLAADPTDHRFTEIGMVGNWVGMEAALAAFDGDDPVGFWGRVADAVGEYPTVDPEQLTAEIECEWSAARALLSGEAGKYEYSRERTPQQWAKVFVCHRDTFVKRCREGKIRHEKLTDKSYRVHVDDLPRNHPKARKSVAGR